MSNKNHTNDVVLGALLVGGLIGTSYFLVKKCCCKPVNNDRLHAFKGQLEDIISSLNKNAKSILNNVGEHTEDWSERLENFKDTIKDEMECITDPKHKHARIGLIVGGILGGLLVGAGTTMLLSPKAEKTCEGLLDCLGSQFTGMKDDLTEVVRTKAEQHPIHEIIDFAMAGKQLWDRIKSK